MERVVMGSPVRRATGAALLLALLCVRSPAMIGGGDGDGDRERLLNDQSQVFDRLSSLRKRMERLAAKLEQEGNSHKAELLRKSIAEIDSRALEARKDDLLRKLKDSSLQTFEQQERLLNEEALAAIEASEAKYVQAIDELTKLAAPRLDMPDSPLLANLQERLTAIDAAIAEYRAEIERNRFNAHLRQQLLWIYQEKRRTLEQIQEYEPDAL